MEFLGETNFEIQREMLIAQSLVRFKTNLRNHAYSNKFNFPVCYLLLRFGGTLRDQILKIYDICNRIVKTKSIEIEDLGAP